MSALATLRALAALPLFAAGAALPLAAQDGATARDSVRPSSVAAAPAGARRDTSSTMPGSPETAKLAARRARRSGDDQVSALLFTLGAAAVGGTAGALHGDACFGSGDRMANRAMLSGLAIGIPFSMVATSMADREVDGAAGRAPATPRAPARPTANRTGVSTRDMLVMPVAGAAFGAVLGAPIGAVQGARHPERCGGGIADGTGRGAAQMAIGGAVVGGGIAALMAMSELAMRIDARHDARADSLAARVRRAGIRPDTVRGQQSPHTGALLSFVLPGAGHVRAGETRRGLLMGALTGALIVVTANAAPDACAEGGAGEGCTRAQSARSTLSAGATALVWALAVADGYGAAERHNRRLVERAVSRAGR